MDAIRLRDSMSSKADDEPNELLNDGIEEAFNLKVIRSEFKPSSKEKKDNANGNNVFASSLR